MNWVKEFDDQVKNMVDESNSKETAQYWKKCNILPIHSLCTWESAITSTRSWAIWFILKFEIFFFKLVIFIYLNIVRFNFW